MTDQNRFGGDRYRQDEYRTQDYRDYGPDRGRSYGARSYGGDYRSDRGGQSYGSGAYEDRSFGGQSGGYGEEAYRDRQYGSADGQSGYGRYGQNYGQGRAYQAGYNQGDYGRSYDPRYGNREAAGSMLHQGYRAPFGDHSGFDRNEFRQYDGEGQRYQYNDYQPTHDQAGRYADGGSSYGAYRQGSQNDRGLWDQTRDEVSSWFGDDDAARRRRMDEIRANRDGDHHGGKGPKGYTRSDDRIREDVNDRLTADYRLDASDIEAKVDNGEVTLTGHVASRHDKRHAEDIVDSIGGVKHVQNNLRVKEKDNAASSYAASGGTSGASSTSTATPTTGATGSTATSRSN